MEELLEKAKAGDVNAYSQLIKSIENDLVKLAASRLKDKSYIDDVLQNVYYKAYIKINTLENNAKFKSWIFTILRNECINTNKINSHRNELNLDSLENIIEDSTNYITESDLNFEQLISNLSEDEKVLLRLKFKENFSNLEIAEELDIPYNTVKSKISRAIKKIMIIVLVLVLFSGFTVLATYIIKQIKAHFTMSTNAINTAVENNYVQEIDSDFIYDKGIGVKVDAIVLDDKNLDISFVYDVLDKEKYGEIVGVGLQDYIIKSGNTVLLDSSSKKQSLIKLIRQNLIKSEYIDNEFRNSLLFSAIYDLKDTKNIEIQINTIRVNCNKNYFYDIEGNWKIKHNIIEKLNDHSEITYTMEENNYIKSAEVSLLDTYIKFEIEFNKEFKYNKTSEIYLCNENNKFDWINNNFTEESNRLNIYFDISKYEDDIDELFLNIPEENGKDIIIKFRRDS